MSSEKGIASAFGPIIGKFPAYALDDAFEVRTRKGGTVLMLMLDTGEEYMLATAEKDKSGNIEVKEVLNIKRLFEMLRENKGR